MRFGATSVDLREQDKLDAYITYSEVIGDGSSGIYTEDEATSAMKALSTTVKERDTQSILRQCESTCRSLLSRAAVVDESEILNAEVNKTSSRHLRRHQEREKQLAVA